MTHFHQALEFIAGLVGFFAVIIGLVFLLTYLEALAAPPTVSAGV